MCSAMKPLMPTVRRWSKKRPYVDGFRNRSSAGGDHPFVDAFDTLDRQHDVDGREPVHRARIGDHLGLEELDEFDQVTRYTVWPIRHELCHLDPAVGISEHSPGVFVVLHLTNPLPKPQNLGVERH